MATQEKALGDGLFDASDWATLGLILAIVGCFLLANSILFRDPKALVRKHFGARGEKLHTLREHMFHRVQITLGFTYLLIGFALQLFGRLRPVPAGAEPSFPTLWIGVIVVLTVGLQAVGWWWSLHAFRRHVRTYFAEHPAELETDVLKAREVGELFGLSSFGDDTVQSFASRLRERMRLPAQSSIAPSDPEPVFEEH